MRGAPDSLLSDITPEGRRETHLDTILLNGNNVAILVSSQRLCRMSRTHFCSRCRVGCRQSQDPQTPHNRIL